MIQIIRVLKIDGKINDLQEGILTLLFDDEYADYGQPVLKKKKIKFDVNPFSVAKNMAAKIYKGTYSEKQISAALLCGKKLLKSVVMDDISRFLK